MTIKIYTNIQDLTGLGEEYLVDSQGNVLGKFLNGDLLTFNCKCIDCNEKTAITA